MLLGSLNSEQGRLPVDVEEGLHQEVLLLVDEALPYFFQDLFVWGLGLLE